MADSSNPDSWLWIIGVVLVLLGSLGQNLGNNLVSLSHSEKLKAKDAETHRRKSFDVERKKIREAGVVLNAADEENANTEASMKAEASIKAELDRIDRAEKESQATEGKHGAMWVTGTTIFVTGSLLTFAAFGFAAQSLLASLESIQFVSNVLFAKYVHKEEITIRMLLATLSIVGGNVLVVIFSSHEADLLDSKRIIYLYLNNEPFIGYVVGTFVIWCGCEATFQRYHDARIKHNKRYWKHSIVEPICYVVASAIIGAVAVLNAKCMSMLIQVSIRGIVDEFVMAPLWVILVTWICFVAYWLRRLDKGLELFPPLFFIPVIQVAFVFFAIVIGGIYFEEFNLFNTQQWIGFAFGVAMILGGVYGLAPTDIDVLSVGVVLPIDYEPEATNNTTSPDGHAVSPVSVDNALKQEKLDLLDKLQMQEGGLQGAESLHLEAAVAFKERDKPVAVSSPDPAENATDAGKKYVQTAAVAAEAATPGAGDQSVPASLDGELDDAASKTPKKRKVIKHGSATPNAVDTPV